MPRPKRHAEQHGPSPVRLGQQLHVGQQRHRPAEHQRHVGRDDAARENHTRLQARNQRRPRRGSLVVELVGRWRKRPDKCAKCSSGEATRTHASPLPQTLLRGGDDPGQQRRLGEVAEGEFARPRPILRFVHEQIDDGEMQADDSYRRQHRERDQHMLEAQVLEAQVLEAQACAKGVERRGAIVLPR